MASIFLLEDQTVTTNGFGPILAATSGDQLQITLGILEVKEQQSLDVGLYGSVDGEAWSAKPLTAFPRKFYTGTSSIVFSLASFPDIRFLRVGYHLIRWGHWKDGPAFRLYVFGETTL